MIRPIVFPALMGAGMGAMMLWVIHGRMIQGDTALGPLLWFLIAHVAIIALAAGLVWLTARRWPAVSARLSRLHRPGVKHVAAMVLGAVASAAAIHVVLHGGL